MHAQEAAPDSLCNDFFVLLLYMTSLFEVSYGYGVVDCMPCMHETAFTTSYFVWYSPRMVMGVRKARYNT